MCSGREIKCLLAETAPAGPGEPEPSPTWAGPRTVPPCPPPARGRWPCRGCCGGCSSWRRRLSRCSLPPALPLPGPACLPFPSSSACPGRVSSLPVGARCPVLCVVGETSLSDGRPHPTTPVSHCLLSVSFLASAAEEGSELGQQGISQKEH